jgi:hypothetical protein
MPEKNVYERAVKLWGKNPQLLQCVEEMSELTKEIMKYVNRKQNNVTEIIEEVADVEIMLSQLKYCLSIEKEVEAYKTGKVVKISEKLDEWENK